jgi:hypothetical protein
MISCRKGLRKAPVSRASAADKSPLEKPETVAGTAGKRQSDAPLASPGSLCARPVGVGSCWSAVAPGAARVVHRTAERQHIPRADVMGRNGAGGVAVAAPAIWQVDGLCVPAIDETHRTQVRKSDPWPQQQR